jgi:ABC-type multidrug transport system fused ATPase/permease subunit
MHLYASSQKLQLYFPIINRINNNFFLCFRYTMTGKEGDTTFIEIDQLLEVTNICLFRFIFFKSYYLSFFSKGNKSSLEHVSCDKSFKLSWEKISVTLPKPSLNLFDKIRHKAPKEDKQIVIDVDGIANSNEVLAIMGASGAGKTSLLNALNFRNRGSLEVSLN